MISRVLFVDDDREVLSSFTRLFKETYHVETALGGEEGLKILSRGEVFKVVVSDLKMPRMDGITFLERVQEISPETVCMLLTGYADMDSAIEAVNRGRIFRFLTKPCPPPLLAKALSGAVEQFDLVQARKELHSLLKVNRVMEGIIAGFSSLVEARDPYTAGHQRRVAELSCAIARNMGYVAERVDALRIAGLLHDIGKVYVPADFLNRPGKLRNEEFAIIKMHPEVGADILKSVEFDWPIASIIRQHHERLDGSGYPHGLTGGGLLEEARIITVADVLDAMSSHRPYRARLGLTLAMEELKNHAGTVYDARAVAACLAVFEDDAFRDYFTSADGKLPAGAGCPRTSAACASGGKIGAGSGQP